MQQGVDYYEVYCSCGQDVEIELSEQTTFARIRCKKCLQWLLYKIDRYLVQKPLGKGGMGAVYLALDEQKNEQVVLKILEKPKQTMLDHFIRECMMLQGLDHKSIVKMLKQGSYHDIFYIVMEYLPGATLTQLVQERGPFPPREVAKIFLGVLSALQYAGNLQVIHRDIKPDNIYISKSGEVKLLDFGLAKIVGDSYGLSADNTMKGTPRYMPFEQFADVKNVDERADIYGVGASMYFLLCASPPFAQWSGNELITAKYRNAYTPLSQQRGDVPPEIVRIVEKAMGHRPADRYPGVGEMLQELLTFYRSCEKGK